MSSIPSDLIKAYERTDFRVLEPRGFILRIGQCSAELWAIYLETGATCAAFLTAWKPYSQDTSEDENALAQARLHRQLSLLGYVTWNGIGVNADESWRGEESVFVLGLPFESAKVIGADFRQNAIVWAGADAVPRLIVLR